ncbi:MAG: lysophospholipid acyltransferase family protein [Pseudomonadota bacterium]
MTDEIEFNPSLWRRIVAVTRLVWLMLVTLVAAVSLAIGKLVTPRRWGQQWRIWHFHVWSRLLIHGMGGRSSCHGKVPDRPFFLASNHHSYLDIPVLAQYLPCVFVSKAEVRDWPFVGWLTRLADTIYINRERRRDIPQANAAIRTALDRGDSVALFPEGTSSDSPWALPIRPPLLQEVALANIPLHTAALHFATQPGDPSPRDAIYYFRDLSFASHVWMLLHLRGFTVTVRLAPEAVSHRDRKQLAEQVREQIHALQAIANGTDERPVDSDEQAITLGSMRR